MTILASAHYVSFTTDSWTTSQCTESLLSITAHWITDVWDRQSAVLAATPISGSSPASVERSSPASVEKPSLASVERPSPASVDMENSSSRSHFMWQTRPCLRRQNQDQKFAVANHENFREILEILRSENANTDATSGLSLYVLWVTTPWSLDVNIYCAASACAQF